MPRLRLVCLDVVGVLEALIQMKLALGCVPKPAPPAPATTPASRRSPSPAARNPRRNDRRLADPIHRDVPLPSRTHGDVIVEQAITMVRFGFRHHPALGARSTSADGLVHDPTGMGADFIGWRGCPLQAELDPDGFLGKLKLRAYKAVIEERVPREQWETISVVVRVTGRPERQLRYGEILRELAAFEQGIPECATCPLAGGKPLGCYRYVTYPVDAVAERLLFELFVEGLDEPDSIADQLFRDIVSQVDEESGWYGERGEDGALAELAEPLEHVWGTGDDEQRVDSAQLLAALFIPLDTLPLVVAYARFWLELFQHVDRRLEAAGVRVEGDALEIHAEGGDGLDPEGIAAQAMGSLSLAKQLAGSRTLGELRHVSAMLTAAIPGAVEEGWTIVVDG